MALHISAVLFLGVIVFVLVRKAGLTVWHAVICVLLGFYLAGSQMAPSIRSCGDSVADMLAGMSF
ncbi:hypothetical protein LO772_08690 [Yinghuangia sp. ASG 101]|uniref:hypothetical protein n=1 Tax=Yinghuangia sp. ASG 101 TaxID=2896848 RepID=UPI001E51A32D|nr:hypothetical protein [Yinghuangia sp. ASG 101]UGQ13657.1 hypothetical protein LO772_08690 [Yinghuangia sp. ASG 101]